VVNIDDARSLLGTHEGCSADELRSAYRKRLHELHPDVRGGGAAAAADTRELIAAYQLVLQASAPVLAATRVEPSVEGFTHYAEPVATAQRGEWVSEPVATRVDSGPAPRHEDGAAIDASLGVWMVESDTLALNCPADEAYALLVDAAHRLGDVTHVDRSSFEFLEFLVRSTSGDAISVVCSLQGRANGSTEVFFTLEPLATARGPLPEVAEVAAMIGQLIRERLSLG
jgi:hypothetical protein